MTERSYIYPGTNIEVCRVCGGWIAWCCQDAPRESVERFYQRVHERRSYVEHIAFGGDVARPKCSCGGNP
jgi:hypothetical protein